MSRRILRVGMVGAGFMGQLAHLMNFVEADRCKVVALAEFRPGLRQAVAERYAIPKTYATHTELLLDPEVEAVVVVTPRPYTGPVTLDCLNSGKHVLSEKPMAGTLEQAERLVEAASRNNVRYCVGYMKRQDEGVQWAKATLDTLRATGELGPITFVRAHCFMGDSYCKADGHVVTEEPATYPDGGWPLGPSDFSEQNTRDFAFYLNTHSHNTNLLRYLLGATPTIDHVNFGIQAGRQAILNFNSFLASLETGRLSHRGWDEVTEVYFADGRLILRTPPPLLKNVCAQVELYKAGASQLIISPQLNWTWAFRRQAQAFVDDILDDRLSLNSGFDALEDVRLIESMWREELERLRRFASSRAVCRS